MNPFEGVKNFKQSEFDSPDKPGSGSNMDEEFLQLLDRARDAAGVPFTITSGFRTKVHNKKVGGTRDSAHTRGFAADIRVTNSTNRFKIVSALISVGFTRIGIASTFIHVDNDPDKVEHVIWTY